jgi:hypothetical protein
VWWRNTQTAPCVPSAKHYAAGNKIYLISSINFAVRGTARVFRITACTGPCSRTWRFSKCPRRTNCYAILYLTVKKKKEKILWF